MKALRKRIIALYLAVILIFCAFGTDSVAMGAHLILPDLNEPQSSLACPGAGEFFTGSLPLQEQQSVLELSTDWQSIVVLRPGRLAEGKSGLRETQVSFYLPMSLRKTTFCRGYAIAEGGAPAAHGREVIVCYIHNQDGAKG